MGQSLEPRNLRFGGGHNQQIRNWTAVNRRYPPSRLAIFRYSGSQILTPKSRHAPHTTVTAIPHPT